MEVVYPPKNKTKMQLLIKNILPVSSIINIAKLASCSAFGKTI